MKITEILVKEMSFRRRKVFKIAFTQSMYARGVYVKILTDAGLSGMGEAVPMPFVTGETIGGFKFFTPSGFISAADNDCIER